jgi:hypothetical protein
MKALGETTPISKSQSDKDYMTTTGNIIPLNREARRLIKRNKIAKGATKWPLK